MTHRRAVLLLIGCATVWGAGFPLNKLALATVSPMLFLSARFGLAAVVLLPLLVKADRATWRAGITLGLLFSVQLGLFAAGLVTIPPARAAFLFTVQTPVVPVLVLLATKKAPTRRALIGVAVATLGSWLLTKAGNPGGGDLAAGDAMMLSSAILAAVYIVAAGHLGSRHDPWHLLGAQFLVMAVFGIVASPFVETARFAPTTLTGTMIVVLAAFSIFTFGGQLVGQRLVRPTEAALIFAIEPVVAAVASYLVFGEKFGGIQWVGGALILAAALAVPSSNR